MPECVWKWARRKPMVAGLVVALHLVGAAGLAGILWHSNRATLAAEQARSESKRAEGELWNAKFNEARAVRIAGGPGARVKSSALLHQLILRPDLTLAQTLRLREEAIAQLALVDIMMPTNWIPKNSTDPLTWTSDLGRYLRETGSNCVELCEYPSQRVLASFSGPPRATVDQMELSRDNQFLAVRFGGANGDVLVWNLDSQELVLRTACRKASGGHRLYITQDNRTLVMRTPQGLMLQAITNHSRPRLLRPGHLVDRMAFSPDSRHLAVLSHRGTNTVEFWDADSGATLGSFNMEFEPKRLAWHPDGTRLALGGDHGRMELRTVTRSATGRWKVGEAVPLIGHLGYIDMMSFSPDGSALATYSFDSSSVIWDLISGRPLLREQRLAVTGFGLGGDQIVGARDRPTVDCVGTLLRQTGYRTVAWAGEARTSQGVWISPDSRLGVVNFGSKVSEAEGDCLLWDFARGVELARIKGVWAQFSADSRTLYTFERYGANCVRRYDVSPETLAHLPEDWHQGVLVHQGSTREVIATGSISPDGRTLVVAATDALIFLDALGERPAGRWDKPAHYVNLSPDGKWMATAHQHEPTTLRMATNGQAFCRLAKYSQAKFSPDSRWLGVTTKDACSVYDLGVLRPDRPQPAYPPIPMEVGGNSVPTLVFSRDSRMFAVSYNLMLVRLYETATGRELATLSPPTPAPIKGNHALTFSPDGQWLLAAKDDGETIAWNLPVIRSELKKLGLDWEDLP